MTSLVARIEAARQASGPSDAVEAPARQEAVMDGTYVPEPVAENDVMSYLLNPPLPQTLDEQPDPDPEPVPVAAPAARKPRRSAPSRAVTLVAKPKEQTTMQNPTVVVRVPTNGHNGATHTPRGSDPENCLAWLDFLAKSVHPSALHLLLGYYRRLGWIPGPDHAWLRDVCDGIARQNRNMTWDSLRIAPEELIKVHAESYRWLAAMFAPTKAAASAIGANGNGAIRTKKGASRRN